MIRNAFFSLLGTVFTVIGVIGLVLPIIPGILFLILAIACFSVVGPRGSKGRCNEDGLSRRERAELRLWLSSRRVMDSMPGFKNR